MALHAPGAQGSCYRLAACIDLHAHCLLDNAQRCNVLDQKQFECLQPDGSSGAAQDLQPQAVLQQKKAYAPPLSGGQDMGCKGHVVSSTTKCVIPAALFPREVGQCEGPRTGGRGAGPAPVPAYRPPMAAAAQALGEGGSSSSDLIVAKKKKKYAPPTGAAVGSPATAPHRPSGPQRSRAPPRACRAYWPAYNAGGCPVVSAGGLPAIQLGAGPRCAPTDTNAIAIAIAAAAIGRRPLACPPAAGPPLPPVSAFATDSWGDCALSAPAVDWGASSETGSHGAGRAGGGVGNDADAKTTLAFLVEMFNTVDTDLVADVLRACHGSCDDAIASLMDLQSQAHTTTSQGSSCDASDRDEGGGGAGGPCDWAANGGEWDVSGTPNDYNYTDLTLEQKAAALRKAHPDFGAAEVEAALLAHGGDVNATAAALVLGADARAEERAFERDRQYAEKLARELNTVGSAGAAQPSSGPVQAPALVGSPGSGASSQGSRGRAAGAASTVQARLKAAFPDVDADVLLSTLVVANNDYSAAHKILCDAGLEEAGHSSAAQQAPALPPPPPPQQMLASVAPLAAPVLVAKPAPAARRAPGLRRMSGSYQQSPAAAESSRLKQQIYTEEMEACGAEKANAAYRELVALASKAHMSGDYDAASSIKREAHELRDKASKLAKDARHRIRQRTNKLLINEYKVDLHGLDAAQAVDALHDTLAKFAGEHSTMRLVFITGQGLHSAKGQSVLRPALLQEIASLGLEHEVAVGAVSVLIRPEVGDQA